MNFLMVMPKYVKCGQGYNFNFGLAYISSYMKSKGLNVFCLNLNHSDIAIKEQILKMVIQNDINVVCTGGMSSHYHSINEVLNATKSIDVALTTICGGSIVTSNPTLAVENMQIDYGVIGEGEETMCELATALCNDGNIDVNGIVYIQNSQLIITQKREPMDLSLSIMPDYKGFEYEHYLSLFLPSNSDLFSILDEVRPAYIFTSRSCPFSCTFCYQSLGNKYRQRPLDDVFKEIDYLIENYGVNIFIILDDLFSLDKERMYEFARRMKPYNIPWQTQFRVPDADINVLKALKNSGVFAISYGIESINDNILKSMKKHTTKEQIENALNLTKSANIALYGNIILGDPADTEETINESITWWKEHSEYGINISMIYTMPNSLDYQYAIANGLIKDEFKFMKERFPIINLTQIPEKKFQKIVSFINTISSNEQVYRLGVILETKKEGQCYSFKMMCPDCHKISTYKNMNHPSYNKFFNIICRNCNTHLRVKMKDCYPDKFKFFNKIVSKTVQTTYKLMNNNSVFRYCYFNYLLPLIRKNNKLHKYILNYR